MLRRGEIQKTLPNIVSQFVVKVTSPKQKDKMLLLSLFDSERYRYFLKRNEILGNFQNMVKNLEF